MYVTLILDDGKETKAQKIEMQKNAISVKEVLKCFDLEKLLPEEKIWIKRLNFDEFRKDAYTLESVLEWDKFHNCEIAISPNCPNKSLAPATVDAKHKFSQDSAGTINNSKRKALEEMLIMNIVLENQKSNK